MKNLAKLLALTLIASVCLSACTKETVAPKKPVQSDIKTSGGGTEAGDGNDYLG